MFERIKNITLLIFVFLLPWQTRLIFRQNEIEYLEISLYAIDLLLILLVVTRIISKNFKSSPEADMSSVEISNDKFLSFKIVLIFFVLWNSASVLWAADKLLAIQHVAWILLAAGLAWLVVIYENKAGLIFWFVIGLMLSAWLGIWQFFAQYAFANKWFGLAYHNPKDPGTSYLEVFSDGKVVHWLRSYGSFDHPNIFGFVMVLGIILALWLFHKKKSSKIETVFLYLALVSLTAGLYASLSRSAFLGLGMALVVFFLKTRFSNMKKPLLVAGMVLVAFVSLYSAPLFARSNINARLEQKSISERELYFQQSKEVIKHNYLWGVGTGNYVSHLKKENPGNPSWIYQPVHNVFMLIWSELGIVGLLAFVVLYVTIIMRAYKNSPLGFCLLIFILPAMFLDHWLWSLHFGLVFLGFILGILLESDLNNLMSSRTCFGIARDAETGSA